MKQNLALTEAKQGVWDKIIQGVDQCWEKLVLIHEKRKPCKEYSPTLQRNKQTNIKNSQYAKRYIQFLIERTT